MDQRGSRLEVSAVQLGADGGFATSVPHLQERFSSHYTEQRSELVLLGLVMSKGARVIGRHRLGRAGGGTSVALSKNAWEVGKHTSSSDFCRLNFDSW